MQLKSFPQHHQYFHCQYHDRYNIGVCQNGDDDDLVDCRCPFCLYCVLYMGATLASATHALKDDARSWKFKKKEHLTYLKEACMHVYLSGLWNGFVCFCLTNYDHNWFSHEIGHLHTNQFFGETKIGNRAPRSSKTCEICIKLFQSQGFGKHLGNFLFGSEAQLFDSSCV